MQVVSQESLKKPCLGVKLFAHLMPPRFTTSFSESNNFKCVYSSRPITSQTRQLACSKINDYSPDHTAGKSFLVILYSFHIHACGRFTVAQSIFHTDHQQNIYLVQYTVCDNLSCHRGASM